MGNEEFPPSRRSHRWHLGLVCWPPRGNYESNRWKVRVYSRCPSFSPIWASRGDGSSGSGRESLQCAHVPRTEQDLYRRILLFPAFQSWKVYDHHWRGVFSPFWIVGNSWTLTSSEFSRFFQVIYITLSCEIFVNWCHKRQSTTNRDDYRNFSRRLCRRSPKDENWKTDTSNNNTKHGHRDRKSISKSLERIVGVTLEACVINSHCRRHTNSILYLSF